eukprot:5152828-Amphidinium_carterae.1
MSEEVEKSMSNWGNFHKQLKNLEALLRNADRRRRLHYTCIRGRFDYLAEKFTRWSNSLYEGRWHE